MRAILDRFEGDFAICEKPDRTMMNIPRCDIPEGAREGDVLLVQDGKITLDRSGTERRKARIRKLMADLWKTPGTPS